MTRLQEVTLEQASLLNNTPMHDVQSDKKYVIGDFSYIMDIDMKENIEYINEDNPYYTIIKTGFFEWDSFINILIRYDTVIRNTVTGEEYICNRQVALIPEEDYNNMTIENEAPKDEVQELKERVNVLEKEVAELKHLTRFEKEKQRLKEYGKQVVNKIRRMEEEAN